jgi:hypothetical protein
MTDHLQPVIPDGTGYYARVRDLRFLQISEDDVTTWRSRLAPFGLSQSEFTELRRRLAASLTADGFDPHMCDLRLRGSSAEFYSGHHKQLPVARGEIFGVFREARGRLPETFELDEIEHRLHGWLADGDMPTRRPFDSMYHLRIERASSDVDLQLSSDEVVAKCEQEAATRGLLPAQVRVRHPSYNFVEKDLVLAALPRTVATCALLSDMVRRDVTLAVFPSVGPPDTTEQVGPLSAHFRPTDWVVSLMTTPAFANELES